MSDWARPLGIAVLALLGALAVGVLGAALVLHEPAAATRLIAEYILISGALSLAVGGLGTVLGTRLFPTLSLKIALAYAVASFGAIITILYTPLLMFKEPGDLHLLVLMLVCFLVISVGLAVLLGRGVARSVTSLRAAAREIASGNFSARVSTPGGDELSELSAAFNRMSEQLGAAFERERRLETARRDLVAAISHDLRTPLASLRAMLEALQDGVVHDPDSVATYQDRMHGQIDRLSRLVDDLFELSRLEGGAPLTLMSVNLGELIEETAQGFRPAADRAGVSLGTEIASGVGACELDPAQIQRVLVNLIDNALRHTPAGGTICVRAGGASNQVIIEVIDTGAGLREEDVPHVFDRFYRGEPSRSQETGGTGLGLAISRAIVQAHRGEIRAERLQPHGARFVVNLPIGRTEGPNGGGTWDPGA
jgi:signal transduction histidine kinase